MLAFRIIGLRISAKIRYEYLKALFALPVAVLDTVPTGQTSTTITSTANLLQLGISDKLGTLIQFSALMLTSIIVVSSVWLERPHKILMYPGLHILLGIDSSLLLSLGLHWTDLRLHGPADDEAERR